MTHDRRILATLLKQKSCNGGLHQPVLVPLRMLFDKSAHGAVKILRQLIFHTDVRGHRIRGLVQLSPLAVNTPIRPCQPKSCQNSGFLASKKPRFARNRCCTGFWRKPTATNRKQERRCHLSSRGWGLFPCVKQKLGAHLRFTRAVLWKNCAKPHGQRQNNLCSRLLISPTWITRNIQFFAPDDRPTEMCTHAL